MARLGASQRVGDVRSIWDAGRYRQNGLPGRVGLRRGCGGGRGASRGTRLREMAGDLGRGQAQTAQRDLVPGLETAGGRGRGTGRRRATFSGSWFCSARRPPPPVDPSTFSRVPLLHDLGLAVVEVARRGPAGRCRPSRAPPTGSWATAMSTGVPARLWARRAEASRLPAARSAPSRSASAVERSGVNCGSPVPGDAHARDGDGPARRPGRATFFIRRDIALGGRRVVVAAHPDVGGAEVGDRVEEAVLGGGCRGPWCRRSR